MFSVQCENDLSNKRIILGICGSIAAYKAYDLIRLCREAGALVQVVVTNTALNFVNITTLQALSGCAVFNSFTEADATAAMGHIKLANWADIILIAPISAHSMARLAHGMADDLLSTLCLVSSKPIAIAPAMNPNMWQHTAVQTNLRILQQRDVLVWGPASGAMACGAIGLGRLLEPTQILAHLVKQFNHGPLSGQKWLINAGPTREAIDPVRYISNRSSGKMGFAVATAAIRAGAEVCLITGPVNLPTPTGAKRIDIITASEMLESVLSELDNSDVFVATAAVADFKPQQQAAHKVKKKTNHLKLVLAPTIDILQAVKATQHDLFVVGFAAETQHLETYAKTKLATKGLDMIAANLVNQTDIGFDSDDNALTVFTASSTKVLPKTSKKLLAEQLVNLINAEYLQKDNG